MTPARINISLAYRESLGLFNSSAWYSHRIQVYQHRTRTHAQTVKWLPHSTLNALGIHPSYMTLVFINVTKGRAINYIIHLSV